MSAVQETLGKAARDPRAAARAVADQATTARDAVEGARDAQRLKREHPRLVPPVEGWGALEALHRTYVAEVSTPAMAVSWETARLLRHLCDACAPRRIADLGSGFSSCVLRDYAAVAPHDVEVVSVDDSGEWLERTREFLRANGHETGELRTWQEFAAGPGAPFDLIFHDLAGGELREAGMSVAVGALGPRGVIVFDDAHHAGHRREARRVARDAGLATYSLQRWTGDSYGRFALLAAP